MTEKQNIFKLIIFMLIYNIFKTCDRFLDSMFMRNTQEYHE